MNKLFTIVVAGVLSMFLWTAPARAQQEESGFYNASGSTASSLDRPIPIACKAKTPRKTYKVKPGHISKEFCLPGYHLQIKVRKSWAYVSCRAVGDVYRVTVYRPGWSEWRPWWYAIKMDGASCFIHALPG